MRTTGRCRVGSDGLSSTSSSGSAVQTCQTTCPTNDDGRARTTPDGQVVISPLTCTNTDVGGPDSTERPPSRGPQTPGAAVSNPPPATRKAGQSRCESTGS